MRIFIHHDYGLPLPVTVDICDQLRDWWGMMEMFWYRWCLSDPDSGTDGRRQVPEMIRGLWGYSHFKVSRAEYSVRHKLHSSIPSSLCTLINNGQPHSECKYLRLAPAAVFILKYSACNPRPAWWIYSLKVDWWEHGWDYTGEGEGWDQWRRNVCQEIIVWDCGQVMTSRWIITAL